MNFKKHSDIEGQHAFLSASKYHWINYDEEKVRDAFLRYRATLKGTELHDFACQCIRLKQRLQKSNKTLNMYVNDAISLKMIPEQILYYSDNCFGTADAISLDAKTGMLRIHDLKTGTVPASEHQLEIYAALFCLEYHIDPYDIDVELRIYQSNEARCYYPLPDVITSIMQKIIIFDKEIEAIKLEEK